MLRKRISIFRPVLTRLLETYIFESLNDKELVRVAGDYALPFLQGLVTNDMNHFNSSEANSMYSMILNKTGQLLFDIIIYKTREGNAFLLECDKRASLDLQRHLRVYRVRKRVEIGSFEKVLKPWVIFRPDGLEMKIDFSRVTSEIIISPDPRVKSLGIRLLASPDKNWNDIARLFCKPQEMLLEAPKCKMNYRLHLYKNGVGEGIVDHPPGKSFPLESNGDLLHGISFNKGFYIGQEPTACVYQARMVCKRLMPLQVTSQVPESVNTVRSLDGSNIGVIRGVSFNRCLALMRVEEAFSLSAVMIDGNICYISQPDWWPK